MADFGQSKKSSFRISCLDSEFLNKKQFPNMNLNDANGFKENKKSVWKRIHVFAKLKILIRQHSKKRLHRFLKNIY